MAFYTIKRIKTPTPALVSGKVGVDVVLLNRDSGALIVLHRDLDEVDGTFDPDELMADLDEDYAPNDFGVV